jgi:hypothetical protein
MNAGKLVASSWSEGAAFSCFRLVRDGVGWVGAGGGHQTQGGGRERLESFHA